MASVVQICNRALQKLGQRNITSLEDDSVEANTCANAYEFVRDDELRAHPWNFSITRAQLAASTDEPLFDFEYAYPLPTDCLRILPPRDQTLDWMVEGRSILTNYTAPLELRYIAQITDPQQFDANFVEALACKMALEMCEKLTQSNSKKEAVKAEYAEAIKRARRHNAFENIAQRPPVDRWVTARL